MPHYQKYKLRRIDLFVASFTLKETHWNAKLCHWLSGKFLYETVKNDSNSWKQASKNSVKTYKNYKNPIKTLSNSCTWNLSNTNFWPKAKIQSCRTESCSIWNFPSTRFVYISNKILVRALKLLKMWRYWSLKETAMSSEQRSGFTYNRWQNIWPRVRKWGKIGQDHKFFIFAFA